jgi:cystathionine gamma-lyase/homocysteine desulfhydrase
MHSGVPAQVRAPEGITDGTIRLSIGIAQSNELVAELPQALASNMS